MPPFVSVLVVNYNGAAYLPDCLDALALQSVPRHRFEVVVVDNASRDDSAQLVRRRYPWVRLVQSKVNLGFAGGNNLAADLAHGGRLVLLNPDAVPDAHWLEELLRAADADSAAMIASKLVLAADPGTLNSAGLVLLRDGRGADRGFRRPDRGQYERRGAVFAGCGAALLVPRPARGPLLDSRLFLYGEDLDLAWRRQKLGLGTVYAPRSVARHAVGAATGQQSPRFTFWSERNRALAALKNGDPVLATYSALVLAAKLPQAVLRSLRGPRVGRARWAVTLAVARALASYLWLAPGVLAGRLMGRWPR